MTMSNWETTRIIVNHLEIFLDGGTFHVVSPIQIETLTYVEIVQFMNERSLIDVGYSALLRKMVKHSESPKLRTSSRASKI